MKQKIHDGAEKLLKICLDLKADDNLLIVADMPNQSVADAIAYVGKAIGAEVSIALMEKRKNHAEDPPKPIMAAMKEADAAVLATVFSMSNSQARRDACEQGTRILSLPGCSESTLTEGAIKADFPSIEPTLRKVGKILTSGKGIKVKTAAGSDFTLTLNGRAAVDQTCIAKTPGSWSPFPNLETAIGPESVNGIIVVDGAIVPGGPPDSSVKVTIKDSIIINIEGNESAKKLSKYLESFKDPSVYRVVEFGVGMNPNAVIGRGSMAEDESQFGTVHLGVGDGRTFGIDNIAPSHIDLVIRMPEVFVDEKLILKEESLKI